jgi:membrane protein implicated in regulation of membrane protease activity
MNDELLKPLAKVWGVTLGAISFTLANLQTMLSIVLLSLSILFTAWQFRRAKQKADKEDKQ